ncbi:MAG: hypothetical protein WAO21_06235 [Verrucomicrobiia bacterium]
MKTNCRRKSLKFGRFMTKLRATIAAHVPAGYEDESGFHYVADAGDCFSFDFDSGGQSFFQRGSSPPPPWRLPPESILRLQKLSAEDLLKISTQERKNEHST